ncbi:hypothetical protein FA95DRAFT_1559648 [Auriscalpium vulgare]|uniref:Uncharacterized protein n=1 Tax=Auriscalpium vulgare TaxID=40419 RepID=A0ACB8RTM7_9AGAM|nr:hypothetical protein FA95DRAFT_1559648 [Auriscalpium vulgare]
MLDRAVTKHPLFTSTALITRHLCFLPQIDVCHCTTTCALWLHIDPITALSPHHTLVRIHEPDSGTAVEPPQPHFHTLVGPPDLFARHSVLLRRFCTATGTPHCSSPALTHLIMGKHVCNMLHQQPSLRRVPLVWQVCLSVSPCGRQRVRAFSTSTSMESAILASFDRGGTIGVAYLGIAISSMFYGVTCIQSFHYFRSANLGQNTTVLNALVTTLLLLDTTHQILAIHAFYYYLITHYADPIALLSNIWSIEVGIIFNALIAFVVESFFVARIWRLSSNRFVTGVCGFFTAAHLAMNLLFPIRGMFIPNLAEAEVKLKSTGVTGLCVAVVADVLISAFTSFYLQRSRTGFRKSDDMVTKLIILTVTTGTLTTLFVIAALIAYLAAPSALYVLFFDFMLAKLYTNAVLTSLNSRDSIRRALNDSALNSVPLSKFSAETGATASSNIPHHQVVSIAMDRTVGSDMAKPYSLDRGI